MRNEINAQSQRKQLICEVITKVPWCLLANHLWLTLQQVNYSRALQLSH